MLTKIGTNSYLTEDGFPAVPLWIDRPDRKGTRFVHWHGPTYDGGCDYLTVSVVTDTFRHSGVLTLDYQDWYGQTGNELRAVYQRIGRERLKQLRDETNALLQREWEKSSESPWQGPHPNQDRMLDVLLPVAGSNEWMTLGF